MGFPFEKLLCSASCIEWAGRAG